MLRNSIIGILTFVVLLVAVNLMWLDIIIFSQHKQEPVSVTAPPPPANTDECGSACQKIITSEVAKQLETQLITPVIKQPAVPDVGSNSVKEYYIPLGSGMTRSSDYVALNGAEAYIDTSLYGPIKQAVFEVFLRNTTGNGQVYAKLFNVTDQHDVWFSEVFMEGSPVTRKDTTITLEPGSKLYRVMLKSTLAYDVYVDNARVKIVTQ